MEQGFDRSIILVLAGLVSLLAVTVFAMWLGKKKPSIQANIQSPSSDTEPTVSNHDAVLFVLPGGRVDYINDPVREWFGLEPTELPDIERLARRVRPSEDFLTICAQEGQARVAVNGRVAEIISYNVPGQYPGILVSLRRPTFSPFGPEGRSASEAILKIVTDFGQSIASSLNLEATIHAVLDNVSRLIPADVLEIKVWDNSHVQLLPYRLTSLSASDRSVEKANVSQFSGYTDNLINDQRPQFIANTHAYTDFEPVAGDETVPLRSYIGIPLLAGGELVGTLEAGQIVAEGFSDEDVNLLQLIGGQAAIAVRNAVLYESEQRRTAEMAGLASLAEAAGAMQDPQDLFGRLVQGLAPLFDVRILGFLLYDENRRTLEGQIPFQGLPSHVVDIYKALIRPGSEAEQIFTSQELILTPDAGEDDRWRDLGLMDIAQAASMRETAMIPLVSGGRSLGYLQLSNHRQEQMPFSPDELRLMNIVANQAAAIIDNAQLVQQSRQRAQRAEALRRIASLASSTATLDEILLFSIQELVRLLRADSGVIFLLDEGQGFLRAHEQSLYGITQEQVSVVSHLYPGEVQYRETVTGSQRSFVSGQLRKEENILPLYRPVFETLKFESVIIVPLVVREHSLGELMIGSGKSDFFDNFDMQVVATSAGQLASAIEEASLTSQTDESLRQRVDQLTTLTRIGRELNTTSDLNRLLQTIYDESLRLTHAECGSLLLLEPGADPAQMKIGLALGCPHEAILDSIEIKAIDSGEPLQINDLAEVEAQSIHEGIQSLLIAPIAYQGQTVGLLHLHSPRTHFFDETGIEIVQALAVQAAIAINNVQRYIKETGQGELLRRRAETLSMLADISYSIGPDQLMEDALQSIATAIRQVTEFDLVLISVFEKEDGMLHRVSGAGFDDGVLSELKTRHQPWESIRQILRPEFSMSRSYFIPVENAPVIPSDVQVLTTSESSQTRKAGNWNPEDLLIIPLLDQQDNPLGLISLDMPRNRLRPDLPTVETIESFAAQATLVISTQGRLAEYRERVDYLSSGIQRQQRLLSVSQNDLPIMLHKDLEQTISLQNLDQRVQRIRAGLAIIESVSRQLDSSSAMLALAREVLIQLDMSVALVAEDTAEGPRLTQVLGNTPRNINPEALFGQRNPLRTCLQNGETLLVMNLDENDEWRETSLLTALRAKSFICLPVVVENKSVAAVLAVSTDPMSIVRDEDQQVYFQIARQASLILQNISLLSETRRRLQEVNLLLDFSRQLSGLEPVGIVRTLLDSALRTIPKAAHAGVVLLWDERQSLLLPRAVANYADNDSLLRIQYRSGEALPGMVFAEHTPRRIDEVNFARDYALSAENLLHYRQATGGRLPVSSLLIPIQTGDNCIGVLVLDNFNTPAAFQAEDQTLLLSLCQQVALSLENVRLVQATQERAGQLQALTDVTAVMTSSLRSEELVASMLDQIKPLIPFDTATLWLREGQRLNVAATRGFADTDERIGLAVEVADSALFKEMIRTGQGILVGNVLEDNRFPSLVEAMRLSWLGIPLISKGEVTGVIALEKMEPFYYNREHLQVGTTFTGQAAVALENARLYQESLGRAAELDERSKRLAMLNRFSSELSGLLDAEQALRMTAQELQQAMGAWRVSVISVVDGKAAVRYILPEAGLLPEVLPESDIFQHLSATQGVFTTDDVRQEESLASLQEFLGEETFGLMILPVSRGTGEGAFMFIHMKEGLHFRPTEIELARTIANQASIALENARLFQSTVATAERLTILNQVSSEISGSLDPEEIYVAIHQATRRLMPAEAFTIVLVDEDKHDMEGVYLFDQDERAANMRVPLGEGISGKVISTGQPLLLHDSDETDRMGGITIGERGTPNSILAVPMTLGERVLGALSAQSYEFNVYTDDDLQILKTFANQAIIAIQNARLFAETQRLAEELEQRVVERTAQLEKEQRNTETLLRILTEVSASLDLDRALNRTLALLNEAIGAEQGTIMLLHPEDNMLHYRAGYGYLTDTRSEHKTYTLKVGEGLAGWVVENREATLVEDLDLDTRWIKVSGDEKRHRSAVVAPLVVGEDVIGVLMVYHRQPNYFSPEELGLVKAIASQVAVAINNANLYELIRDQAERLGSMLRREQEEASRSQAILEAVADGVLVTDDASRISFVNTSAQLIMDLDADNVLGQSIEDFGGLFGKAASAWMETIRLWSESATAYQPGETYAEQLELDNGRVILVHLAPVMLHNDFLGTVSIFRDITHEVEVDRLKSEFVATVSHELRTPMTSIKGYVEILMMGAAGALNENQTHFLDIVKNNTERLNILVNDLLDVSRIEAGRVTLSMQPVDLREVAEDVISDVLRRSQEENRPMGISMHAQQDLPRVTGDLERVRQILGNLVDNAYNYTPENGTINVEMKANGKEIQINVSDTGVGIKPDDQQRIFERFYRGEHPLVLATPGTGLGLPIVRQLVEMHHGRIWVTSKGIPGEGSTFSFTLPVYNSGE